MDNPAVGDAKAALNELIKEESLGIRLERALRCLRPILENPARFEPGFEHREMIVNEIEAAADVNATVPERAKHIAGAIELIFALCRSAW